MVGRETGTQRVKVTGKSKWRAIEACLLIILYRGEEKREGRSLKS